MWKCVLSIVKFSLIGGERPQIKKNLDWEEFYQICKNHKIEVIISHGLDLLKEYIDIPNNIYLKFQMDRRVAVARDAVQNFSSEELIQSFEQNDTDYIMLKGSVIKQFYPKPEFRMMADLDILFRREQETKVDEILTNLGYTCVHKGEKDNSYIRKPFMNIEMHYSLVEERVKYNGYYKDPWARAKRAKEGSCEYYFSWEDFFVYMIVHLAKHFYNGGSGIRSIIDVWIYTLKKPDCDWNYIYQELKKLELDIFAKHIIKLVKIWFEEDESSEIYDDLSDFILESGVFGTERNESIISVAESHEDYSKGLAKAWIKKCFPSYQFMCIDYKYLKIYPYLLVVAWLHRLLNVLIKKHYRIGEVFSNMLTNKNEVQTIQKLFREIGLD